MSTPKASLLVIMVNALVFLCVLLLPGLTTEKTLYDSYLVNAAAVQLEVEDLDAARDFYSGLLDFEPVPLAGSPAPASSTAAYVMPDGRRLFLRSKPENAGRSASGTGVFLFRVRNGIERLHRRLVARSNLPELEVEEMKPACVSRLLSAGVVKKFVAQDPDKNSFIFCHFRGALVEGVLRDCLLD